MHSTRSTISVWKYFNFLCRTFDRDKFCTDEKIIKTSEDKAKISCNDHKDSGAATGGKREAVNAPEFYACRGKSVVTHRN